MATGTDQDHDEAGNTAQQAGNTAQEAGHTAKAAGHRAADSSALRWLARAGFAARGVTYILVGWIAVPMYPYSWLPGTGWAIGLSRPQLGP